jgi:hypothetical protein
MIELGWLAPDGTMYECNTMEHIIIAEDIAKKLGWHELDTEGNRVCADDFLMQHGYVHITRSMIFGHEYFLLHEKHYTPAQKEWLKPRVIESWDFLEHFAQDEWKDELFN